MNRDFLYGYGAGKASGCGGGNPNTVDTVTGTLADPWGGLDFFDLCEAVYSDTATAMISFDASALGYGRIFGYLIPTSDTELIMTGADLDLNLNQNTSYLLEWLNGQLHKAYTQDSGTILDLSAYASVIPSTLKIIWHPMP